MVFTEGGTRATTDSQVEAGKGKVKANKDPHLYIYSEVLGVTVVVPTYCCPLHQDVRSIKLPRCHCPHLPAT